MPSQYEIPAFGGATDKLHGWMLEAVSEGDIWLQAQKPAVEWQSVMDVLGPRYDGGKNVEAGQSATGFNLVRYDYSQIRATLANFKHAGEFIPTEDDAQALFDRAHLLTNLDRHWERTTFSNLVLRDAIGYALAKGTAYLYEDWDSGMWGPGFGDIRLRAFDPADVSFIQLPKSHDIQQAYVVLIREELPLQLAKRMYAYNPAFAKALTADRDSPGWIQKGLQRVQQFVSPMLRAAGSIRKDNSAYPTVDIFHAYTLDSSINDRPEPIDMGARGTNWKYTVPYLGQPLPQAMTNPATGQPWTLPAQPDDCLMFPLRRLTIFSRSAGVAYDGSSPFWHGQVPLARIRFNDRPWEALGASQVGDAITMQDGVIQIMRGMEDSAAARLDPPALYDENRYDENWAKAFNPRKAGVRAGTDLSQGPGIEYPFPPQFYDVPLWIGGAGGFVDQQSQRIDKITSAQDLVAIAKARQIPSADTLEKLLEMSGPIVQDMVGALVQPLTQLGEWRKAYYLQFYTRARMVKIADPEAEELFNPATYTPEFLAKYTLKTTATDGTASYRFKDQAKIARADLIPDVKGEAPQATMDRAKVYLRELRYEVTESGLSELNRMSQTLLYVQLNKSGAVPISWWTMAKIAKIPNFGPPPAGTNTELERVIAQKNMEAEMQVELAQKLQEATGGAPGGGAPPEGGGGSGEGPGRPATFNKPPHLVNKPGEGRSTIATS